MCPHTRPFVLAEKKGKIEVRMGLWALVCAISDQNICGKFECYAKNILPQFQSIGIYVIM